MDWILYLLLALAAAGDILLAVVLAKVMRKNAGPEQKIDTADDFVRAVTPVLQSETDLLAEQLRAMQGESARTTSATLRDFSAVLAENQRQSAANSTARLEAIDRAGAARQRAANDALLAQLTMMENRLKNLEDSLNHAMNSIRNSVHDLHDEAVNLEEVEKSLVHEFTFCSVQMVYDMTREVPREVKYCFISITKEAFANIMKHSNATKVQLILREHPGLYQLCIEDNGTDTFYDPEKSGIGIVNMKERVNALDGTIQIFTDKGFRIFITIPKCG